jgi:hypothetical protein
MANITRFLTFCLLGAMLAWSTCHCWTNSELQSFRSDIKKERQADPGLGVITSHSVSTLVRKTGVAASPLSKYEWRSHIQPWSPAKMWSATLGAGIVFGLLGLAFPLILGHWLVLLICSAVITTGLYSVANIDLVRSVMPVANNEEYLPRHTLRERFLDEIGRDGMPVEMKPLTQWFLRAAIHYQNAHPAVKELVEFELKANEEGSREARARALLTVLNKSDQDHLKELLRKLSVELLVLPNPANNHLGFNAPEQAYLQGSIDQRAGGSPDARQVAQLIEAAAATGTNGEFQRTGVDALAGLAIVEIARLSDNLTATLLRRANGLVQWSTMLLAICGLLVILVRWQRHVREVAARADRTVKARPEWDALGYLRGKGGPVNVFAARACWHDLDQNEEIKSTPAGHILSQAASAWLGMRDREQARSAANAAKEDWFDRYTNEREGLNYVIWAIPSLGFVGTVLGIGNAMAKADGILAPGQDQGQQLKLVFQELAVAFDTTLVALLASLVLMLLLHMLRQAEGRVLLDVFGAVQEHFVNRLTIDRPRMQLTISGIRKIECELLESADLPTLEGAGNAIVRVSVLRDIVGDQLLTPREETILLASLDAASYRRVVGAMLDVDPGALASLPAPRRRLYEAWINQRECAEAAEAS